MPLPVHTDSLTYNGVNLKIASCKPEMQAVYSPDGVTYLYTHVRILCRAVWSPDATRSADGAAAATSIDSLRATLMTPRQNLRASVGQGGESASSTWLLSPLLKPDGVTYYPCDANNGPKPLFMNVVAIIGENTMIIDYGIETWITECSTIRPILSHRWEMTHEIDGHFYTNRTINGTVIFRADWMRSVGARPDEFRRYLFHPVPKSFQRRSISVMPSSDGVTYRYSIVDREQNRGITGHYRKIAAYTLTHSEGITAGSYDPAQAVRTMRDVAEAGAQFVGSGLTAGISIGGATIIGVAAGVTYPRRTTQVNIRLYGRRSATYEDLQNAAAAALSNFRFSEHGPIGNGGVIGAITAPVQFFRDSIHWTWITGTDQPLAVEVTATAQLPLYATWWATFFKNKQGLGGIGFADTGGDPTVMAPIVSTAEDLTTAPIQNSFGDWVKNAIEQALETPCSVTTPPSSAVEYTTPVAIDRYPTT